MIKTSFAHLFIQFVSQVVRNVTLVEVRINGTEYFKKTISSAGPLSAHVLYLGGMPPRPRPSTSQPSTPSQPLGVTSELLMDTAGVTHPAMLRARRQAGIISAAATPTALNTLGLVEGKRERRVPQVFFYNFN